VTLAPQLRLSQGQRLALTPVIRTTLELLRLPAAELEEAVARELRENPFLVRAAPAPDLALSVGAERPGPDVIADSPALLEQLHRQIGLMQIAPDVRGMAEYLAAELRDDGYLESPLKDIAAELGVPLALAQAGLEALHRCDPPGVGARTLAECLALQLMDRAALSRPVADAAVARIEDFAQGRLRGLDAALGLDVATVQRIAAVLPSLAARPVKDTAPAQVLRADLIARRDRDGAVTVTLSREGAPVLRLDRRLLKRAGGSDVSTQWRARGEAVIAALRFRGETLLRIGHHLAEAQHPVFSGQSTTILPLTRRETAAALGLHPSTIGRAVAAKCIDIEGRLRPLSDFFSSPLPGADGAMVSAHMVRQRIVAMIAAEPPGSPLSDARICADLNAEGVDIARRTVTKYRQWMRLPSSSGRRRIALNRRLRTGQAGIPRE